MILKITKDAVDTPEGVIRIEESIRYADPDRDLAAIPNCYGLIAIATSHLSIGFRIGEKMTRREGELGVVVDVNGDIGYRVDFSAAEKWVHSRYTFDLERIYRCHWVINKIETFEWRVWDLINCEGDPKCIRYLKDGFRAAVFNKIDRERDRFRACFW